MNVYESLPIRVMLEAAYWLVTMLSTVIEPIAGTASAAVAIVLLTIAVRAVLLPVGLSQMKAGMTRQCLAPQISELQRRYRKNPELLQRKTKELYAKEKASPFAGCLPVLAQVPVLMAVYGLFITPTIGGHPNQLLTQSFLGVPLDAGMIGQISTGDVSWASAAVFIALILLVALIAQASRRLLSTQPTQPLTTPPPGTPDLSGVMRMLSFAPFLTAAFAAFVPLAAGLYLLTTTTWTLGERLTLQKVLGAGSGNSSQ